MHDFAYDGRRLFLYGAILLLIGALGSCSSHKPKLSTEDAITDDFLQLRVKAESVITDSVRREKFMQGTHALEDGMRTFDQTAIEIIRDYQKAFADYATDKTVLNDLAAKYRAEQSKAIAQFVNAHTAMAASVTAGEWKPLAKQEAKLISNVKAAAARSVQ